MVGNMAHTVAISWAVLVCPFIAAAQTASYIELKPINSPINACVGAGGASKSSNWKFLPELTKIIHLHESLLTKKLRQWRQHFERRTSTCNSTMQLNPRIGIINNSATHVQKRSRLLQQIGESEATSKFHTFVDYNKVCERATGFKFSYDTYQQ